MKLIAFFTILSFMMLPCKSLSQNKMLENGFSLKFSFGFPPSQYGFDGDLPIPDELKLSNTFGLEIGNQWYFNPGDNFGLGLDVNWIDVVYGMEKYSDPILGELNRITLEGSFLEFGPLGTFALNDIIALEGYYNLRPTYLVTYIYENTDDYVLLQKFNFLHGLGFGLRVKFLYFGYEYTFGNLDGELSGGGEYEDIDLLYGKQPMDANNSKLIIGFKF